MVTALYCATQAAKIAAKRRANGHVHIDYLNEDEHLSPKHTSPKHSPQGGGHSPMSGAVDDLPMIPIDVSGGSVGHLLHTVSTC